MNLNFKFLTTILMIFLISSCCSWKYNSVDFEFSVEELNHLGPYKIGDTLYFESNLGNIDTIAVIDTMEEREKGSKCFISQPPYHNKSITIRHLPKDLWAGTNQSQGEEKKLTYQTLIIISKSPIDSLGKIAGYHIQFKEFTTSTNPLINPKEISINEKTISDCYKITHGYPNRVVKSTDIEFVYWTDRFGLTAYTNKGGETWLIK